MRRQQRFLRQILKTRHEIGQAGLEQPLVSKGKQTIGKKLTPNPTLLSDAERRLVEAFRRLSEDRKDALIEQAERSVMTPEAGT